MEKERPTFTDEQIQYLRSNIQLTRKHNGIRITVGQAGEVDVEVHPDFVNPLGYRISNVGRK